MYTKDVPLQPNSWEEAICKYALFPLEQEIPAPKTYIEKIAKDFLLNEKTSTDIRKLKEINRCISACERYAEYHKTPKKFGGLTPIEIHVEYGKDDDKSKRSSDIVPDLQAPQEKSAVLPCENTTEDNKDAPLEGKNNNTKITDIPRVSELSSIKEVCAFFYSLSKDDAFNTVPSDSKGAKSLIDKLATEQFRNLYTTSVKDNGLSGQFNIARKCLCNFYWELQQKESEEQRKQAEAKIATGNYTGNYQDIAAGIRQEPQSAVDYLLNSTQNLSNTPAKQDNKPLSSKQPDAGEKAPAKTPAKDEEIWMQRFSIGNTCDEEKVNRLVKEFYNRSIEELKEFESSYRQPVNPLENMYILAPLSLIIQEKENKKAV